MVESTKTGSLRFPYILFDLGSTLIYFDGDWDVALREAARAAGEYLAHLGYPLPMDVFPAAYYDLMMAFYQKRSDHHVEYPAWFVLNEAMKQFGCSVSEDILRQALRVFYAVTQVRWHPEVDAAATLAKLLRRGHRLAIVSNASDDADVQTLVEQAGLREYFDFVLTSERVGYRKPSPVIFTQALAFWGAQPEQALMVGDTLNADIVGAKQSKIANVWISRRVDTAENQSAARRHQPDAIVQTLEALLPLLDHWPENRL